MYGALSSKRTIEQTPVDSKVERRTCVVMLENTIMKKRLLSKYKPFPVFAKVQACDEEKTIFFKIGSWTLFNL